MNYKTKPKYLRYAFAMLAACFVCLLSAIFALDNKSARAETQAFEGAQVFYIGDVITAEDYKISNVKAEEMKVVYPSGGVFGGEKFTVEQAGR